MDFKLVMINPPQGAVYWSAKYMWSGGKASPTWLDLYTGIEFVGVGEPQTLTIAAYFESPLKESKLLHHYAPPTIKSTWTYIYDAAADTLTSQPHAPYLAKWVVAEHGNGWGKQPEPEPSGFPWVVLGLAALLIVLVIVGGEE